MSSTFSVTHNTKGSPSLIKGLHFVDIKNEVLGKDYKLSLVFVGTKRMSTINRTYRKKDSATDILSFPLEVDSGEIFICPQYAAKKSKEFERPLKNFLTFLFIHGLFHLKGLTHGSTMERKEREIRGKFGI
ncbi:MAG: rRNA maturation RNase YbeY [Parcubacteria group bacterium CG11_big_fil_rev_8_21_14_0_20_39_22]|nr:MAG: rRNA maturation RNase YbeY [Parcubacteria group bacterium CG11_big_fil_rev_8_21_14_0_20_39_22]